MYINWQLIDGLYFIMVFCFYFFGIKIYRYVANRQGWVKKNFRGEFIPIGYGLLLILLCIGYGLFGFSSLSGPMKVVLILLVLFIFIGWIDDCYGNEHVKGIKGHFSTFFKTGRPTTGVLKAVIGGGGACLFAASVTHNAFDFLLYSVFLALSTNLLNLLDLRPGRALKGFWLLLAVGMLGGHISTFPSPFFVFIFAFSLAAAPYDFREKAMLGDAGANGLGFVSGTFCVLSLPRIGIVYLLVIYLVIHWYAEQGSISSFIKKHALLRRVDEWGRDSES